MTIFYLCYLLALFETEAVVVQAQVQHRVIGLQKLADSLDEGGSVLLSNLHVRAESVPSQVKHSQTLVPKQRFEQRLCANAGEVVPAKVQFFEKYVLSDEFGQCWPNCIAELVV